MKTFIKSLSKYLNENDIQLMINGYTSPYMNSNINPRTGRVRIGMPAMRPRKMLSLGTEKNYKSIITKFCQFKLEKTGSIESPVSRELVLDYIDHLTIGNKKYQTIVTEIHTLNKNVFVPILEEEARVPKLSMLNNNKRNNEDDGDEDDDIFQNILKYNNKAQFSHAEIALAVYHMWVTCKNLDHVHKVLLTYYTGLRSAEADNITFGNILEGYSTSNAIIRIRKGKNSKMRHILLFRGAPMDYYLNFFIPYLTLKMENKLLLNNSSTRCEDNLKETIFSNSTYNGCRKAFKKCLEWAVEKLDGKKDSDSIKGGGLHSIRADYATRTQKLLSSYSGENLTSLKYTANFLGHSNINTLQSHYINMGTNFNIYNGQSLRSIIEKYYGEGGRKENIIPNSNNFCFNNLLNRKNPPRQQQQQETEPAERFLNNNKNKSHENLGRLLHIYDDSYILTRPPPPPSNDDEEDVIISYI